MITAESIREMQGPLKKLFRETPSAAQRTLVAEGTLAVEDPTICEIGSHHGTITAGLHPLTGGDGTFACSANMLLEALVGCAGVTLGVVSTAMGLSVENVRVRAEGDLDFRGTLAVDRSVPVAFQAIRLLFSFDSTATDEEIAKLLELTERYCVVHQTLSKGVSCTVSRV